MEIIIQTNIFLFVYLLLHLMQNYPYRRKNGFCFQRKVYGSVCRNTGFFSDERGKYKTPSFKCSSCWAAWGKIETVYGEDIPFQIAEFARLSGVSKIVIGRSSATKRHLLSKPTLTEKLIDYAPNLDVHIIPDTVSNAAVYQLRGVGKESYRILCHGYIKIYCDSDFIQFSRNDFP